jgi:hypothetical protein
MTACCAIAFQSLTASAVADAASPSAKEIDRNIRQKHVLVTKDVTFILILLVFASTLTADGRYVNTVLQSREQFSGGDITPDQKTTGDSPEGVGNCDLRCFDTIGWPDREILRFCLFFASVFFPPPKILLKDRSGVYQAISFTYPRIGPPGAKMLHFRPGSIRIQRY